jgi:hypothetical protein
MEASKSRVYYYHADASPFGGHITHPIEKLITAQAPTSLAQAGGHAASQVGPFKLDDIATGQSAYSEIFGSVNKTNGAWTTLVTSVVEGLNVMEVVTADRVVSRLSVEHPLVGDNPRVSFMGSQFENLRIAGAEVEPVLNLGLLATPGNQFPSVPFVEDKAFLDKAIDQSKTMLGTKGAPDWLASRYGWVNSEEARKKKGYVQCSLVEQVERVKHATSFGHVVNVPGFGNVFLGELIVAQGVFRLTLIRIEMGCAGDGNMSIGTSNSNGSTMP